MKIAGLSLAALLPLALPLPANATGGGTENCIELKKEISIDGSNYFDANTPSSAVRGAPPKNAHYRLTVRNCGATKLDRVKISDPALGLYGVKIPGSQTGRLVAGQQVVITSRSAGFGRLYVPRRCTTNGTYPNVAGAEGLVVRNGVVTETTVRDDDVAYLICQSTQPPAVSIEKQVRLPGGTFVDADTVEAAVIQTVAGNLEYRLIASNVGSGGLTNIRVSDTDLNIQDALASDLLKYGQSVTVTAATPGFANLDAVGRCTTAGDLLNTAKVTAAVRSNPSLSVSAEDPAWVKCAPAAGNPAIELKKQISFDNATWSDADDVDNALQGVAPQDAYYRFVVKNTGDERLDDLIFNDSLLGLDDVPAPPGALDPGQEFVVNYLPFPPFSALLFTDACDKARTVTNTAEVSAISAVNGALVSDEDQAFLKCFDAPQIDLQKEVSIDGGTTWLDADTDAEAAATPVGSGVQYRFVIHNPGTQAIAALAISDPTLGLSDVPLAGETLQPGNSLTITGTHAGFDPLDQPTGCAVQGNVTNSATVSGTSVDTNTAVSDTDAAVVRCEAPANPPAIQLQKQVSVDNGATWLDADTSAAAAVTPVGTGVQYQLWITNIGGETIGSLSVIDADLGINASLDGVTLGNGQSVTVGAGNAGIGALDQPNRCAVAGDVTNTATVSGTSVDTNTAVSDTDAAVVRCEAVATPATCGVCENLSCLLSPSLQQCASGQDVCTTSVDDDGPGGGRQFRRGCAVRADALTLAAQNVDKCRQLEQPGLLPDGAICTLVCDGVGHPNCNLAAGTPIYPAPPESELFPPAP